MKSPIVAYLIPFMLGIMLQEYFPALTVWPSVAVCFVLLASACLVTRYDKTPKATITLMALSVVGLGYTVATARQPELHAKHYVHYLEEDDDSPIWFTVRLTDMPIVTERTVKVMGEVHSITPPNRREGNFENQGKNIEEPLRSAKGRVMLYFRRSPRADTLSLGDCLLLHTRLDHPSAADNPYQFDYQNYLQHRGILRQAFVSEASFRLLFHDDKGIRHWSASLRKHLISVIRCSPLTKRQQGVVEALMLGWRADVDPSTQRQFRDAGVVHLLCVSGLHVGIVAGLLGYGLFFLGNGPRGRRWRGMFQLVGIWFFVLISGMAPSTLRAAWMFTFIVVGQMASSRPPTLNAIASSALLLLMVRPGLLFDVGFQLSYVAVTGIVLLSKPIERLLPFLDTWNLRQLPLRSRLPLQAIQCIWSWAVVSTVAQLSTLPLVLYYFHQFPVFFLLANLLVMPLAGVLLGSIIAMMSFSWWPWVFGMLSRLVALQLQWVDGATSWVAALPHATLNQLYMDWPMALLLAVAIFLFGLALVRRRLALALSGAVAMVLMAAHLYGVATHCRQQREWVLYSAGRHLAFEVVQGHSSILLADSLVAANPTLVSYQRDNYLLMKMVDHSHPQPLSARIRGEHLSVEDHFVQLGQTKMLLVDRQFCDGWKYLERKRDLLPLPHFPQQLDYVILTGNPFVSVSALRMFFDFDTLVVAANNAPSMADHWKMQSDSLGVPLINVANEGALTRRW